jgi:hypothetical protein
VSNEDKAARYHRLRRRASLASTATAALFLLLLLVTGASASIRDWSGSLVPGSFFVSVVVYTAALVLLSSVVQLPFSIYEDLIEAPLPR